MGETPGPLGRDGDAGLARHGDGTGTARGRGALARPRDGGLQRGHGTGTGDTAWGRWHGAGAEDVGHCHRRGTEEWGARDGDTGHGKGTGTPVLAWHGDRDTAHGTDGDTGCWHQTGTRRVLARLKDGISGCRHGKGLGTGAMAGLGDGGRGRGLGTGVTAGHGDRGCGGGPGTVAMAGHSGRVHGRGLWMAAMAGHGDRGRGRWQGTGTEDMAEGWGRWQRQGTGTEDAAEGWERRRWQKTLGTGTAQGHGAASLRVPPLLSQNPRFWGRRPRVEGGGVPTVLTSWRGDKSCPRWGRQQPPERHTGVSEGWDRRAHPPYLSFPDLLPSPWRPLGGGGAHGTHPRRGRFFGARHSTRTPGWRQRWRGPAARRGPAGGGGPWRRGGGGTHGLVGWGGRDTPGPR